MSEGSEKLTGLRNERKPCHFWVDNEVADCYQPIVGADAIWVYCRIARNAHGAWIVSPKRRDGDTRVSLREMAEWCGKSVDTVWRCLQVLEHVGLMRSLRGARSSGRYALADVKDLVTREGGEYDRAVGSFQLPAARAAELKAEVKVLRARLARKTGNREQGTGDGETTETVAQSDSLESDLFSAPDEKCDRSVAQSDKTVAPDVQPSIKQESKKARLTAPPNPPAVQGDLERRIDAALKVLCDSNGFEARRLRLKLRAVMVRRVEFTGDAPETVGAAMHDAWVRVGRASKLLFRHPKAKEFFCEDGMWLDANRWPWDNAEIREERQRAGARVGSYTPQ